MKDPRIGSVKRVSIFKRQFGTVSVLSSSSYANLGVGERQPGVETIQCGMLELEEMH